MKTILVDAVNAFIIETETGFKVFEEMRQMLETFPNRKIILTGADEEQFKKFGLDKAPYEVFSLRHNPEKSDPKYFQLMLAHFGLTANDAVYFEHDPKAVESAESVGIKSYFYNSTERDLEGVRKFLASNL